MSIEIKIYSNDNLIADLVPFVIECSFDLNAYGCGACEIILREKWRQDRGARRGQDIRIYNDSGILIWRGIIRRTIKRLRSDLLRIDAVGYAWLLRDLVLQDNDETAYTNQPPEAIAEDIFDNFINSNSNITAFNADLSGLQIGSFEISAGQNCWEILDRLAAMAGGFVWGIDEQLNLFMRNPSAFDTIPQHTFDLGVDVLDLATVETDQVLNDLLIESNSNSYSIRDENSIVQYGPRYLVVHAPQINNEPDAQLLADGIFTRWANPAPLQVIRAVSPVSPLKPWEGKFAIRDPQREADGAILNTYGSLRYILFAPGINSTLLELQLGALDRTDWQKVFNFAPAFPRLGLSTLANPEAEFE